MSDPFQVLQWDIVKTVFHEEVSYLTQRRWEFAQHKPEIFNALTNNVFSLYHLDQIKRMMDSEKAEIAKQEAEKIKKEQDAQRKLRDEFRSS
jgi:hypothetical protein